MAIDDMLLRLAEADGVGFLRLYGWTPPCLSFGRHEPALRRYSRARIEARRIDTVRRPTGGRAVWHQVELTYAVAAPAATFGRLRETHIAIHQTLAEAVCGLGIPATLAPAPDRAVGIDAGACFSTPAGGEVMVGQRKVIGSAQVRTRTAFLQHGSVLLAGNQRVVGELAEAPTPLADRHRRAHLGWRVASHRPGRRDPRARRWSRRCLPLRPMDLVPVTSDQKQKNHRGTEVVYGVGQG
jgi:lipoyl(octanoyl) transferase